MNRRRHAYLKVQASRLDAHHQHLAANLGGQVFGQGGQRLQMRGRAKTSCFAPIQGFDRTRRLTHLGGVSQQDYIWPKPAQWASKAFGRQPRIDQQKSFWRLGSAKRTQRPHDTAARRIVALQLVANSDNSQFKARRGGFWTRQNCL